MLSNSRKMHVNLNLNNFFKFLVLVVEKHFIIYNCIIDSLMFLIGNNQKQGSLFPEANLDVKIISI